MKTAAANEFPGWRTDGSWLTRLTRRSTLQRNGRKYLRDAYAAAREAGATPFLMWGTLLGCVRENGLMAHDGDLDLGLNFGQYNRKPAWVAAMRRRGYSLDFDQRSKFRFGHPRHSLHIDIDVFFPWEGRIVCSSVADDGHFSAEGFSPEAFHNLREVDFLDGLRVFIPDPPAPVLEAVYGEWRVPNPGYDSSQGPRNRLKLAQGQERPMLPG